MQNPTHDAEGAALAKIYALLIRKAEEKQKAKKMTAEGTAANTGFNENPDPNGDNRYGSL